jgi:hypothetical protein
VQRELRTIRDKGIERLLASMPYQAGDDLPSLRKWTEALTQDAARFQRERAVKSALTRGRRND